MISKGGCMKIGLIAGSGFYKVKDFTVLQEKTLSTPFGKPSDVYFIGNFDKVELIFLPRHGLNHMIPPHQINYRANLWGFKELGVERIVSINAVGGLRSNLVPGSIVIPDQIIDFTKSRSSTFYDGPEVVHIDFTDPYCEELRMNLLGSKIAKELELIDKGVYVAVEGPRLETASEIRFFSQIGGTVIGMTAMPEAVLARELAICYVNIAIVSNQAAGLSKQRLTTTEVIYTMKKSEHRIVGILKEWLPALPVERICSCKDVLENAKFS